MGVCVQEDGVVAHQRHQHDQHLQLIIHPQENRTGDQPQNAAVDEVLEQGDTSDEYSGPLLGGAGVRMRAGDPHPLPGHPRGVPRELTPTSARRSRGQCLDTRDSEPSYSGHGLLARLSRLHRTTMHIAK